MSYREGNQRADLDLSAAGRGFQQTLLLLAFLRWKPGCVLLIDEPDAHLEILRQAQIYSELTNTARQSGGQLLIATHSEVVLNEAEKDQIVAFVGQPHRVRQTVELRKALDFLGYEEFYKAEITGWVLYLEGSTDLEALRILSEVTGNQRAAQALERPFQRYVFNQPDKARAHFFGLREAFPSLRGIAIFDQGPGVHANPSPPLEVLQWRRRELENYFCSPVLLRRWAESSLMADDLFGRMELQRRKAAMEKAITDNTIPAALRDSSHEFWHTVKASDDYLRPVFASFFKELGLKTSMNKSDYAQLARHLRPEDVDPEVCTVLDRIAEIARGKET
jgi:hypothetical protein